MIKEKPILFKDEMIRAILEGRKTQTRRVMKVQPPSDKHQLLTVMSSTDRDKEGKSHWAVLNDERTSVIDGHKQFFACPYGQPGDRLWVRETWRQFKAYDECGCSEAPCGCPDTGTVLYKASHDDGESKWRPSIHMPRWASRITLEITDVRVERLQDVSEEDAKAEGAQHFPDLPGRSPYGQDSRWSMEQPTSVDQCLGSPRWAFANYFCKIAGKAPKGIHDPRPWDANPFVWVIEFKQVTS